MNWLFARETGYRVNLRLETANNFVPLCFDKSWRAANFHDFSLSVEATGQSLIEGRVGVIQDGGTRVQGNTLREGAQPRQIKVRIVRVAEIIRNLYSIQSTVGDW